MPGYLWLLYLTTNTPRLCVTMADYRHRTLADGRGACIQRPHAWRAHYRLRAAIPPPLHHSVTVPLKNTNV